MEAQLREEVAARSGGSSALTEQQLAAMRAEAEEKARKEAELRELALKARMERGGAPAAAAAQAVAGGGLAARMDTGAPGECGCWDGCRLWPASVWASRR